VRSWAGFAPSGRGGGFAVRQQEIGEARTEGGGASRMIMVVGPAAFRGCAFRGARSASWQRAVVMDRLGRRVLEVDLVADLDQHVGGADVCRGQSTVLWTARLYRAIS